MRTVTADERLAGGPGGGDVDDGIPEAHEGKDDAGGEGERNGNQIRVNQ